MELYEANYMRFRRLCPERYKLGNSVVSRARGALDLHLAVVQASSYTTTARLTYYFNGDEGAIYAKPDLRLRIYYDALQAEVLSWAHYKSGVQAAECNEQRSLAEKWAGNRFLYKWLGFCLGQGHIFPGMVSASPRTYFRLGLVTS
jgi:uncharacterized protein YqiB (DUF1249 family)